MRRTSVFRTAVLLTLCLLAICWLAVMQVPSSIQPPQSRTAAAALLQSTNNEIAKTLHAVEHNNALLTVLLSLFGIWAIGTALSIRETEQPSDTLSAREQVLAISQSWADPEILEDGAAMKRILHRRFVFIDGNGNTLGRRAFLRGLRSLRIDSQILNQEVLRIKDNIAVVEGTGRIMYHFPDVLEPLTYHFSTVYRKQNGEWKAISQEVAPLPGSQAGTSTDATREQNHPLHSAA